MTFDHLKIKQNNQSIFNVSFTYLNFIWGRTEVRRIAGSPTGVHFLVMSKTQKWVKLYCIYQNLVKKENGNFFPQAFQKVSFSEVFLIPSNGNMWGFSSLGSRLNLNIKTMSHPLRPEKSNGE